MSNNTIIQWAACLLLEGQRTSCGITTGYPERLPGLFDTSSEAMAVAQAAIGKRPDAITRHLNKELPMEQPECQHLRALVIRILNLNSVVMSVLSDDDGRSTQDMCKPLEGC